MAVTINGSTGITSVNGSAAAPSVTGADTDTGIVYGTNTLSFATGGTTAVTVDSSQNVGIGTASPVSLGSGYTTLDIRGSSGGGFRWGNSTDSSYTYADSTSTVISTATAKPLTFGTNNAERARIDSSGNLLVGKTTTADGTVGGLIQATGRINGTLAASTNSSDTLTIYSTGAAAYRFYVGMGGTVYATSTTITGISDQRLKENIRDLDDGLEKVMALQPRKFDWKEGKGANTKDVRGFIAQEFEYVFPDMIEEWKDPAPEGEEPYKAVNANLIPTLVKAIQEQQAIITQLQADVAALKAPQ